jgi:UrcA family protein
MIIRTRCRLAEVAIVAAGLAAGLPAVAAPQRGQDNLSQLTVVASPGVATRKVIGRTEFGGQLVELSVARNVSYTDLNLVKHADVLALQGRVGDAAKTACAELKNMDPIGAADATRVCERHALAGARPQVDKVVAAAER